MSIYQASALRATPSEAKYIAVSAQVLALINSLETPEDAETLWMAFLEQGHKLSISAFYRHLRKLSEAGSISKLHVSNNKFNYFIVGQVK